MVGSTAMIVNGGSLSRVLAATVEAVVRGESKRADVTITFLNPRRMRALNAEFLGHDYSTDVISFPLLQPDGSIAGDVYICRHDACRNARANRASVREELMRLAIHGALHIVGWEHPEDESRTTSPMWHRQEAYLKALT